MIKQNIKIALFAILAMIGIWLIIFCFIRIDVSTSGIIFFSEGYPKIRIDNKSAVYIENNDREEHIQIQYEHVYGWCQLINPEPSADYTFYTINTKIQFDPSLEYLPTNVIMDSLNVYQYLIKK